MAVWKGAVVPSEMFLSVSKFKMDLLKWKYRECFLKCNTSHLRLWTNCGGWAVVISPCRSDFIAQICDNHRIMVHLTDEGDVVQCVRRRKKKNTPRTLKHAPLQPQNCPSFQSQQRHRLSLWLRGTHSSPRCAGGTPCPTGMVTVRELIQPSSVCLLTCITLVLGGGGGGEGNIHHRTEKKRGGISFTQARLLSLSLSVSNLSLRDADSVEPSERSWVKKKKLPLLTWNTTLCLSRGRCVRVWISACSVACLDAHHAGRSALHEWICAREYFYGSSSTARHGTLQPPPLVCPH